MIVPYALRHTSQLEEWMGFLAPRKKQQFP